ncbi:LOW QUALITY PROTEIN: coiled-coil domain-containing protein 86 [Drosophila sulfurigaster albostrigata]|uniref:LOW QUALITY PROTEIN: coiled-coil domain-containing protein 86 n=1 Tax=Drosophila sulfurigaster albostrigata TaxID=89887 RepID=UPI002D219C59|nr:LOW QUALITY PROTEIN: coiled-coil domain-containing protein 86 [Drosophila sulfurigaster albostrigata]
MVNDNNTAPAPTATASPAPAPAPVQDASNTKTAAKPKTKGKKVLKPEASIPRGQPKSNRPWKTPKQKFSKIKKTVNRLTFEKKEALRNELRYIKEKSKEIKDQRKEAAVQHHQRRVENAERRLANERRAEVVQVIKNPAKLKRMKKKQMRMIEKRDLSQVKVV